MAQRIRLVQGDILPNLRLTLKNADGTPIDVTTATVNLYFRDRGTTTVLDTLTATKPSGGYDGKVIFAFNANTLDVNPGYYEGEVKIDYGSGTQTVYETLQFQVRATFA